MKDLQRSGLTREQWSAMTLYEKFEQVVIFVLSVIIAAIVVASVWALMREVVNRLVLGHSTLSITPPSRWCSA
jgi:hypothetical protein